MTAEEPKVVTRDELIEELARLLDADADEIRTRSAEIELEPPWEAEVVETTESQ